MRVGVGGVAAGERIVVNFLRRPFMTARSGETAIEPASDSYGRIVLDVPEGAQEIAVDYDPPWLMGSPCRRHSACGSGRT